METINPENNSHTFEFLSIEYQRLQQLHFAEKKDEEKRVDFFISITSAAIAGIIILFSSNKTPSYNLLITEVILFLLLLIGLNTLGRIAIATVQSLKIWELRKHIQEIFAKDNDDIKKYINVKDGNNNHNKNKGTILQNSTTLRFLVIIINTFLIGTIIFVPLVYFGMNLYCVFLIILPTMVLAWILLSKYYKLLKRKLEPWKSAF